VTSSRARAYIAHWYLLSSTFLLLTAFTPSNAMAEKVLAKGDDWQVYTDGRIGGFLSWVYGQGMPQGAWEATRDSDGKITNCTQTRQVMGGGFAGLVEQGPSTDGCTPRQGTINSMRVRSGFIANQLGLGVRSSLSPWTTVTAYIQIWAYIESEGRQKNRPNLADVRQGYLKLDGWWGNLTVGRTRALFSRGATDIDSLYAHRWGVGWVGSNVDNVGPTLGMIGFGVMGSGFASGLIYGTPVLAGFQLNIGLFEPIAMYGNGTLTRTKYLRPESELTYEKKFGETGKLVLFGNGVYQKAYKGGYTAPSSDPNVLGSEDTAYGVGYGGRFELGFFHIGFAGHYGKGLGTNYALESTDASTDMSGNLRKVDGYYVQTQFALSQVDLFAGWGTDRIFLTPYDMETPKQGQVVQSVLKHQMGINAGLVYHIKPYLHLDVDYFRAEAAWFYGESQVVHATNAGMTYNW